MQTRERFRIGRITSAMLSLALLGSGSLMAHAQTSGQNAGSTSGQNAGGTSGGQTGSGSMSGGRMGGRQGRGGRMGGSQSGGMSGGRMGGSMASMDDSSGFASLYAGLDPVNQERVRAVFAENKDRIFPNEEDPVMIDPAPWNYPSAAPGAIDTYHYTDYTHDHLAEGSVYDVRFRKAQIMHALELQRAQRALAVRRMMAGMGGSGMSGSSGSSGMRSTP